MTAPKEFDVIGHVHDAMSYPARWETEASAWRATQSRADLSVPYGPHRRQKCDLFFPTGKPRGLLYFIHGGYWQFLSRKHHSHFAAGALAAGYAVALPSYRLAPEVTLPDIAADVTTALIHAAEAVPEIPIRIAGHSAGGHLALRLACAPLPAEVHHRLCHVCAISPITDLTAFLGTGVADILGLTPAIARAESPALQQPLAGITGQVWVGSEELPAFHDQAAALAQSWGWPRRIAPGRNHFDIIEPLAEADSLMSRALMQ